MYLGKYINNLEKKYKKTFFSGVAFNSLHVKKNNIFFAIKGNKFDGNKFIPAAIKNGSNIIVSEKKFKKFPKKILFLRTKNIRKLLSKISFKINNKIPKNLIAVTGTNGKSSIADFYYQILILNQKRVASIGTLGVKSKNFKFKLFNTTTDPIQLSHILKKLKEKKIDNVIMEASSHGLKQNRLDGLEFRIGIFTNLSQDHLDYHKNLKSYFKAKLYLFENLIKKRGNIITDKNIPQFKTLRKIASKNNLSLNTLDDKKNDFKLLSHSFEGDVQKLKVKYKNSIKYINLNLIGKIQLKNVLMAIIAAKKSNLDISNILAVIPKINSVEGRFEKIGKIKNQSKVILDYAHTPEALKTCLLNLKEQFPGRKISLVFGCGGNRDQNKRSKMGKIASKYSDKIYLTDDNPRFENPKKIRNDIKKGVKSLTIKEIPDREKAISEAIKDLNTGEILLVAGKGHEKVQDIGKRKIYFSDKGIILREIKKKNSHLSKNIKLNIIKEISGYKKIRSTISLNKGRINSREVKKNDIFFAIKGKKIDGNKFVGQSFKNNASLVVVNKIKKKFNINRQIKVKNTLKFLTETSKIFRENINTNIIAITGSCGKTSLKELLGNSLKKISRVSISPKSYNNKFGVPISLFNIKKNDEYGVLEVGMDKKGEIDQLTKIIQPDVSIITNINYAHVKNFRNIKNIALAKSEIINNTKTNGYIILNKDDNFFNLLKKISLKKSIKIISFGIKNKKSDIQFDNIKKDGKYFRLFVTVNKFKKYFIISNNFESNIYNILATLAVISIYKNIAKLDRNIFLNFQTPKGRGDFSKIKLKNKNINLIDESYNSNPLSLKSAILNYDKLDTKKSKKYLLLGDMLELGKHSQKLHNSIVPIINKTKVHKVYVKGSKVITIFDKLPKSKKGRILYNKNQIIELIRNDLNNNDYLMIKASNATGLNRIAKDLRGLD